MKVKELIEELKSYNTEAEVTVGDNFYIETNKTITSFTGTKVFATLAEAEELNNYNTIGAIISYKEGIGYTVWNGDPENLEFDWKAVAKGKSETGEQKSEGWSWNQFSLINDYGTVIAICCGRGLWLSTAWTGSRDAKMWAISGSELYNNVCRFAIQNDGRAIARHMYANARHIADSPLFSDAKAFDSGIAETVGHWFVPSKKELLEIQNNACTSHKSEKTSVSCDYDNYLCYAANINNADYWSASQYCYINAIAFDVYFKGSYVGINYKFTTYLSFVALHFGDALS